jgi:hypothetical protein
MLLSLGHAKRHECLHDRRLRGHAGALLGRAAGHPPHTKPIIIVAMAPPMAPHTAGFT